MPRNPKGPKLHVPRRIAHVSLRDETHSVQNGKALGFSPGAFGKTKSFKLFGNLPCLEVDSNGQSTWGLAKQAKQSVLRGAGEPANRSLFTTLTSLRRREPAPRATFLLVGKTDQNSPGGVLLRGFLVRGKQIKRAPHTSRRDPADHPQYEGLGCSIPL